MKPAGQLWALRPFVQLGWKMSRLSVHSRWMTRQMLLPNGLKTGCPGWRGSSVTGLKRPAKHREGSVVMETLMHWLMNLVHRLGTQVQNLQMVHQQAIRAQRILPVTDVEQQATGFATARTKAEALLFSRLQQGLLRRSRQLWEQDSFLQRPFLIPDRETRGSCCWGPGVCSFCVVWASEGRSPVGNWREG